MARVSIHPLIEQAHERFELEKRNAKCHYDDAVAAAVSAFQAAMRQANDAYFMEIGAAADRIRGEIGIAPEE